MKPEVALHNALLEIISCMLSSNAEVRRIAEERKKALEVTEDYAIHLLSIFLTSQEAIEERQMAVILLRQYFETHWTDEFEKFVPPKTSDFVKLKIKSILPAGLLDSLPKVRVHTAYMLASIAAEDFPNDWPDMFNVIFSKLDVNSDRDVEGVIVFIREFSALAVNFQLCSCAEQFYSFLYVICKDVKHSTKIRAEAVQTLSIFTRFHFSDSGQMAKYLGTMNNFCFILCNQLTLPHPEQSDFVLKSQILKAYTCFLNFLPSEFGKTINDILPAIWQIFSRCGELYEQMLAEERVPYRDPSEVEEDVPLFYKVTDDIFVMLVKFLSNIQDMRQIISALPDLIYYIILYTGIAKETELLWKSDPEIYLEEDFGFSILSTRYQAVELLEVMTQKLNSATFQSALAKAVERHFVMSKMRSESYYWRVMEAVMFSVGSLSQYIVSLYDRNELIDLHVVEYLNKWAEDVGSCPAWLLLARTMWVGGKFATLLKLNALSTYVMTTVHNLRESSFILKFSAVRALHYHLNYFEMSDRGMFYMEIRELIVNALLDALEHSHTLILEMGLNALEKLLKPEPPIIGSVQNKLVGLIMGIFAQNITNSSVVASLHNIVNQISTNSDCYKALEIRFLPVITNVIANEEVSEDTFAAKCIAIEFLNMIVKHSPQPLSEELIRYGFVGVYNCMMTLNDGTITQNGADCLRSYLCKASSQIIDLRDNEGRSGVDYILKILRHVLDPQKIELACTQVGLLSITAMHTLGPHLDEHISFLLRGVLSTMQRANSVSVEESQLLIFAYLFYNHLESVINYLTLIPGPRGESALAFVLNKWLSKNYKFGGKYQRNLSIVALTKLMEHTIVTEDQRIAEIKVSNFRVSNSAEIPALFKIMQYLIRVMAKELDHQTTSYDNVMRQVSLHADLNKTIRNLQVDSDLSDNEPCDFDDVEVETVDPLEENDPIYNIKLGDYLSAFLKNVSKSKYFPECKHFLSDSEKKSLVKIGINLEH